MPPNVPVAVSHCRPELCQFVQGLFGFRVVLGIEPRAYFMLGKPSTTELSHHILLCLLTLRQRPRLALNKQSFFLILLSSRDYRPVPPGLPTCSICFGFGFASVLLSASLISYLKVLVSLFLQMIELVFSTKET